MPIEVQGDETQVTSTAQFRSAPEEISLVARCRSGSEPAILARKVIDWQDIEAEAQATADRRINPVDLGTVLVPHDWLLLERGQTAVVTAAAVSHSENYPGARLRAWFEGADSTEVAMPIQTAGVAFKELRIALAPNEDHSVLHVSLLDGDRALWTKAIRTMVVTRRPNWPAFGAVETKLRYDAPIPVTNPQNGSLSYLNYDQGWNQRLNDVVVLLPNGSRYVFWRGASYTPFWAGRYNTGTCYQFAEDLSRPSHHPDGTTDFPEPLNDKELRFGRVQIIESTPARVHVRWSYELSDFYNNTWGDQAIEDYYFYPDGFGTRAVTTVSRPESKFQLTEFIVLTPQSAFPLEVLPSHVADVIFLDGSKESIVFPRPPLEKVANPHQQEMIYRIFDHEGDSMAAIYFTPRDKSTPLASGPLYAAYNGERQLVAPTHWGTHWPLARGRWTEYTGKDEYSTKYFDNIYAGPAYNSFLGFAEWSPPASLFDSVLPTFDASGTSRTMRSQLWVALIAKTDASDESLRQWAQSFSNPPSLQLMGARFDFPSYSIERRAARLIAESSIIEIGIKPTSQWMNPIFEIQRALEKLESVSLDGKAVAVNDYAWDGGTLWINARVGSEGAKIRLQFKKNDNAPRSP